VRARAIRILACPWPLEDLVTSVAGFQKKDLTVPLPGRAVESGPGCPVHGSILRDCAVQVVDDGRRAATGAKVPSEMARSIVT
jgi:hypothetical protein